MLTGKTRVAVNAQLSHLSKRRRDRFGWELQQLAVDCCRVLVQFLDELAAADPDRALWFHETAQLARSHAALAITVSVPMTTTSVGLVYSTNEGPSPST